MPILYLHTDRAEHRFIFIVGIAAFFLRKADWLQLLIIELCWKKYDLTAAEQDFVWLLQILCRRMSKNITGGLI